MSSSIQHGMQNLYGCNNYSESTISPFSPDSTQQFCVWSQTTGQARSLLSQGKCSEGRPQQCPKAD